MALNSQDRVNPRTVTVIVRNLRCGGKKNSDVGVRRVHLRADPAVMAPRDSKKVGIEQKMSLSLVECIGREELGAQITASKNRAVYLAVRPVARKNRKTNNEFIGLNNANSKIMSLE